jgi:hypothetical protein
MSRNSEHTATGARAKAQAANKLPSIKEQKVSAIQQQNKEVIAVGAGVHVPAELTHLFYAAAVKVGLNL